MDKIIDQKNDGYAQIIDGIISEGFAGRSQKFEIPAKEKKTGNIPTHKENTECKTGK
jgi:hypothetical protein